MGSITYLFNQEKFLLEVIYEGIITLDELVEYGRQISSEKSLPRNLKIITDATRAKYNISPQEVNIVKEALMRDLEDFESIKFAYVYENPTGVALSLLLEQRMDSQNFKHKVFSTHSAAIEWLIG
jgi:hypothetical protein